MQKAIIPSFYELQKDKLTSAILQIKKRIREEFLVIVADEEAMLLIQNMFSVVDLAKMGVIHEVLKLSQKRPSIKYHVIYLISPGTDSIKLILNDFKNKKKYSVFDILALGSLTNQDLALIKSSPEVKDPLKGLNEIFLDFIPWFDNGFSFQTKTNFLKMHTTQWINSTAKKLCSILLSLQKFSTFQLIYPQSLEPLAKKVKTQLQSSLQILKKYQFQSYSSTFPVTKVLLFPRELDYQSPLMRSYDYLSLIYNLFFVSTFSAKIDKIQFSRKDHLLWQTKYLNYPDAVEAISIISDKQHKQKQNQSDIDNNTHKFIQQAMKNEFMIDNIEAHIQVIEKLSKMSVNYQALTTLQQTVVNGIDESGLKKTDKQIWKLIDKQFENMKSIQQKTLLQFIALCCFSLESTNQPILKKISEFSKNGQKLIQNISKLDFSPSKLKQKPSNERYDLFRHQPKIVHYLRQFQFGSKTYSLQTKNVGSVQKLARTMPKYGEQSKLVLFSTGYLGINEFVALNRNNKNLIIGSNKIVSPWEYVFDLLQIQTQ